MKVMDINGNCNQSQKSYSYWFRKHISHSSYPRHGVLTFRLASGPGSAPLPFVFTDLQFVCSSFFRFLSNPFSLQLHFFASPSLRCCSLPPLSVLSETLKCISLFCFQAASQLSEGTPLRPPPHSPSSHSLSPHILSYTDTCTHTLP